MYQLLQGMLGFEIKVHEQIKIHRIAHGSVHVTRIFPNTPWFESTLGGFRPSLRTWHPAFRISSTVAPSPSANSREIVPSRSWSSPVLPLRCSLRPRATKNKRINTVYAVQRYFINDIHVPVKGIGCIIQLRCTRRNRKEDTRQNYFALASSAPRRHLPGRLRYLYLYVFQ